MINIAPKQIYSIIVKQLFITIFCFLSVTSWAQNNGPKGNYVLILNSYNESAPWSNSIITPIMHRISNIKDLTAFTVYMNIRLLKNDSIMKKFKRNMFAEYTNPPKTIVLIGNASLSMREEIKEKWGDVPIIFCGEEDYVGPEKYYTEEKIIPLEERIPVSALAQEYNLTMLSAPVYIDQNVELMRHMIPGMNKLIFIADEVYINQQNAEDLGQFLKEKYPHIKYSRYTPNEMSLAELLDSLKEVDNKTGVLFSSWFYELTTMSGYTMIMGSSYRVLASSSVPIFTLRYAGMDDGGMVGGYMYDEESWTEHLITVLQEVINGRSPRNIPFYYPEKAIPTFNYTTLINKGLSPDLCPSDSVFYNKPVNFFDRYKWVIIAFFIIIVILFISQQKRIKILNQLKETQQKEIELNNNYTNLINNTPILYMKEEVVKDGNGNVVDTIYCDVNKYFEKRFVAKSEIIGKKGSEVFPESLPEFLHFINIVVREKRSITFPYYFKAIDTFYDVVLNCSNQPDVIDIFCIDCTELHYAQKQLSSTNHKLSMALDVANIVPWKWDLKNHTILCDVNKPIELSHLSNDENEEQFVVPDTHYFAKIIKEDRERVKEAYQKLVDGEVAKVREEYRVLNLRNGEHQIDWVEAQAAVETRDEQGKPLSLVGSSLIITERKKMEEELIFAKDQAEESNRLKSAFLANMSHEIRTPLNAIVGFSNILASIDEEEEKQEYLNIIESNNTLLLQLISDILDLSKIEAGTLEFSYSDCELNGMMIELENIMLPKVQSEKVKLSFALPQSDCYVCTERNRLMQVLINLITNAIKFTEEGSITFGYEHKGGEIYFYVTDTGCGIAKDKKESIFNRFVKLNSFAQGTGLGLSICQTIVQHMKGKIGVESEEGKGSTFWFTLPYQPGSMPHEEKESYTPLAVEKEKLTILIAEDNESNYILFKSILSKEYNLLHAWNGQEAVELFKAHSPHIILMDINMPVMDGYEATKEIRKYSKNVPIVAVTAFAYASDEQKVMSNGFDAYMSKPINANSLRNKITDILQKRIILL